MSRAIKQTRLKQWAWFIALWLLGFGTMAAVTYPIKLFIKQLSG